MRPASRAMASVTGCTGTGSIVARGIPVVVAVALGFWCDRLHAPTRRWSRPTRRFRFHPEPPSLVRGFPGQYGQRSKVASCLRLRDVDHILSHKKIIRPLHPPYVLAERLRLLAFAQRARAAFVASSFLSSGVRAAMRAFTPLAFSSRCRPRTCQCLEQNSQLSGPLG